MKTHIVHRSGLHLFVSLALLLSSCGGGGESSPPNDPDRVGAGWITITESDMGTSGSTGPSTVSLSGDAFISPTWWRCCTGSGSDSGVTVLWKNTTTGDFGPAFQAPVYCWFLVPFLCGHTWEAIIDLAVGSNVIQITATDPSDNLGRVTSTATGVPDSAPPVVVAANPANGASLIPTNTPITVTFSEAMDPASITAASFLLKDNVNNPVSGSVAYSNRAATFSPYSNLLGTVTYSATITGDARDVAGNSLAVPYQWSFTTTVAPP